VHHGRDLAVRQVADAAEQLGYSRAGLEPVARRAVRIARRGRVFRACHPIAPQQNRFVSIKTIKLTIYPHIAPRYSLKGLEDRIQCPTFVCAAEGDDLSIDAEKFYDALACPKRFARFSTAEGAGQHCESGARTLFHARAFDWLGHVLDRCPQGAAEPGRAVHVR